MASIPGPMVVLDVSSERNSSVGLAAFSMPIGDYMRLSMIVGAWEPPQLRVTDGKDILSLIRTKSLGNIVVVRGAMASSTLRRLVETCAANRELLQYHFSSSMVFPMSILPSRPKAFATIRFITIASFLRPGESKLIPFDGDEDVDSRLAKQLAEHHHECLAGKRSGFECFRAVNFHGRFFFTVEQQATFFTYAASHAGWSGVLLSDVGRRSAKPPWVLTKHSFQDAQFLSIASSDLDSAQSRKSPEPLAELTGRRVMDRPNPFESRAFDDMAMSTDDQDLCSRDPFVFAADLFETSALCWLQALSFLRDAFQHLPETADSRIKMLSRDQRMIERAIRYFSETIRFIDSRAEIGWPVSDPQRVAAISDRLRQDFVALREEATELSSVCKEIIHLTLAEISVRSAQQSLLEGKRVQFVTCLAFVFVPISLVASIFGMNVQEFSPEPPIKYFFGVSAILIVFSVLVLLWVEFDGLRNFWERLQVYRWIY